MAGYGTDGSSVTPQGVWLEWADKPGQQVVPTGGTVAGELSVLAPADASGNGTGGVLAEAAKRLDEVATTLATTVNGVYSGSLPVADPPGSTVTPVGDFFTLGTPGFAGPPPPMAVARNHPLNSPPPRRPRVGPTTWCGRRSPPELPRPISSTS